MNDQQTTSEEPALNRQSDSGSACNDLLSALFAWRSAEVHHGAVVLGERQGDKAAAFEQVEHAARALRIIADGIRRDQPDAVLMPRELTAENGAKAALSGEFHLTCEVANPDYDPDDHEDDFESEVLTQIMPVPWDTIKRVHRAAVAAVSR